MFNLRYISHFKDYGFMVFSGLLLCFSIYYAVKHFKAPDQAGQIDSVTIRLIPQSSSLQSLVGLSLFGEAPKRPQPAIIKKQPPKPLQKAKTQPRTRIDIIITGLVASEHHQFAAAMLRVNNQPEKLYRVGEPLGQTNVILYAVSDDQIIIDNQGTQQTILIKRPELNPEQQTAPLKTLPDEGIQVIAAKDKKS